MPYYLRVALNFIFLKVLKTSAPHTINNNGTTIKVSLLNCQAASKSK